jgi:hypothetical protein
LIYGWINHKELLYFASIRIEVTLLHFHKFFKERNNSFWYHLPPLTTIFNHFQTVAGHLPCKAHPQAEGHATNQLISQLISEHRKYSCHSRGFVRLASTPQTDFF